MFEKIISATDLVGADDAPVTTALEIAKHCRGKLYILHVLESSSSRNRHLVKHFRTGKELANNPDYRKEVSDTLADSYAAPLGTYRNYEIEVTAGYPFEQILSRARKTAADLIVIGPHSTRAREKGVVRVKGKVGTTAQGIIMNQCCPVMIVNQHFSHQRLQFKNLVLCMDFSESCMGAFRYALKLAAVHDAQIFVYNMLPVPPSSQYTQAMYASDLKIAQRRLDAVCREIPPENYAECQAWGGVYPHLEILKYAAKKEADTIVMGSHTKDNSGKWYVGSAVERVSYRATCPVIVLTGSAAA